MDALGNASALFTSVPLDWIVLSALIVVLALDSLRSGIGRALAISIALPLAATLFSLMQSSIFIGESAMLQSDTAQAGAFGALFVAAYFLVRRMGLDYIDGGRGEPVQALIAGAAAAAVFACIWLQTPVLSDIWAMSDRIQDIFAEGYRFIWLLGAYGALAFARG